MFIQSTPSDTLNNLLVTPDDFSRYTCADGSAYGAGSVSLNWCIRKHIPDLLATSQTAVEKAVGYLLTPRYHRTTLVWNGEHKLQLPHLGVEKLNVSSTRVTTQTETVSPFLLSSVMSFDDNGTQAVKVSRSLVKRPADVLVRNVLNALIPTDTEYSLDGTEWVIRLQRVYAESVEYKIQHASEVYVDIDPATTGTWVPVYPGTDIQIPVLRVETADTKLRFWFATWVLIDAPFLQDGYDLYGSQFYKLITEIDFQEWVEQSTLPVPADTVVATLEDSVYGIVSFEWDPLQICPEYPVEIAVSYKTNPSVLGMSGDLAILREALMHLVAAELPLGMCDCPVSEGFIKQAQRPYTDIRINQVTGETILNPKFGNTYGQLVFQEKLGRVAKWAKGVRI